MYGPSSALRAELSAMYGPSCPLRAELSTGRVVRESPGGTHGKGNKCDKNVEYKRTDNKGTTI